MAVRHPAYAALPSLDSTKNQPRELPAGDPRRPLVTSSRRGRSATAVVSTARKLVFKRKPLCGRDFDAGVVEAGAERDVRAGISRDERRDRLSGAAGREPSALFAGDDSSGHLI